jgi:calcium-dependent protein kinase
MIDTKRDSRFSMNVVNLELTKGTRIETVYDHVTDGRIIGSGVSGVVREVVHKNTHIKYACKCMSLENVISDAALSQLRAEVVILVQLDHPNIVRLEEVYESEAEIYLVFECLKGGELFDRLDEQVDYHYTEATCARLVNQMLCAVRYCHTKGIVHRDLKLENFLFDTAAEDAELKLIDFGLSKHFVCGESHHEPVGTPYTVSPEVILGAYSEACDLWAIGVLTYLLLSGETPFGGCGGESLATVRNKILRSKVSFEPEEIWGVISDRAKCFINDLLVKDPNCRPTAEQAQKHAWLELGRVKANGVKSLLSPKVVESLVNFKSYDNMRKLVCEIISFTLIPEQINELRKEFECVDTDRTGEITFESLKSILTDSAASGNMGALTEDEVRTIFLSLKMDKKALTIHYHEFIAACLSQCDVDERNLRLAFDRIDSERKGFITVDDAMDMMGCDGSEESVRKMFNEAHKKCWASKEAQLSYEDFVRLMKGGSPTSQPADTVEVELVAIGGSDEDLTASSRQRRRSKSLSSSEEHDIDQLRDAVLSTRKEKFRVDSIGVGADSKDDTKTPLKSSRDAYRAQREMHIAILQASSKFEQIKAERAHKDKFVNHKAGLTLARKSPLLRPQPSPKHPRIKVGAGLAVWRDSMDSDSPPEQQQLDDFKLGGLSDLENLDYSGGQLTMSSSTSALDYPKTCERMDKRGALLGTGNKATKDGTGGGRLRMKSDVSGMFSKPSAECEEGHHGGTLVVGGGGGGAWTGSELGMEMDLEALAERDDEDTGGSGKKKSERGWLWK